MVLFFALLLSLANQAINSVAPNSVEALVLDDNTGKPLYGVNILTDAGFGTITNADGRFCVDSVQGKTINISHIGYKTQVIAIDTIPSVIRLHPSVYELSPVYLTAVNIDTDSLTSSIFNKMKKSLKSGVNNNDNYLYRQTTLYGDTLCYEFLEAFFTAGSSYSLKNLSLVNGRYAELPADSTYFHLSMSNMFSMSTVSYIKEYKPQKGKNVIPFICTVPSSKYYDIDVWLFEDEIGQGTYIINFNPRKEITEPIMKGSVYMDVNTSSILHLSSECIVPLANLADNEKYGGVLTSYVDFQQKDDVPIVNYVRNTLRIKYTQPTTEKTHSITVNSLMSKVNVPVTMERGEKLKWTDNLLDAVKVSNYDADFWKENPVVKRTEFEESVIKMFESKNLLGTFQ